eukprot:1059537-Prymnesium_polylepis.1
MATKCTSCWTRTSSASAARPRYAQGCRWPSLARPLKGRCIRDAATVTLEKVQEPGEWEVCGQRVRRHLYTVSITYK